MILSKLNGVHDNIYKLNLANFGLKDDELSSLKTMRNLHFLRLENNKITGNLLTNLKEPKHLNYLNLNRNPLSESAWETLEHLAFVDKVYLWQTGFDQDKRNLALDIF